MDKVHFLLASLIGALSVGATVMASPQGPSGGVDPVVASFERDLSRPPATGPSSAQVAREADPLYAAINAALWQGAEHARLLAAFERGLDREPARGDRVVLADRRDDPLQRHVNAMLWREQTGATSLAYRWYREPLPLN
ncbi:MAG: hypothetical protein GWO16_03665 [Gammaproteobacteria bacterium]|nr:hypothetical protein [Gammaproteobacteria bacterium]NIR97181.1 hypothetical protein [Gammaproteobacteria bacterium]NIT62898.1 hypothetical protein [Gammaproteobacteria bacterium]NIV19863.1 hypothetical protein [Gammaproteobacteria bacterium]NIY31478.1 hypothetical protein [Gammaproteobacteria bacterium]